jgi:hypothetical protein
MVADLVSPGRQHGTTEPLRDPGPLDRWQDRAGTLDAALAVLDRAEADGRVTPAFPLHRLAFYPGAHEDAPALCEPRLRSLRHSSFMGLFHNGDRFCRFWFQDLRRFVLFLTLMRESKWLREDGPGNFCLAKLAEEAQMSVARASQVLGVCTSTGDFVRHSDERDARYLVFEPSQAACAALKQLAVECCGAGAALRGRDNPAPLLGPAAMRQVYRSVIDESLQCLAKGRLCDRGTGSLTFYLAVADLALHSPIVLPDFIRREASRLQVTTVTLRNLLRRAEQGGWIHKAGRMLSIPQDAQARAMVGAQIVTHHLSAVLHAAEEALSRQRQATASGST